MNKILTSNSFWVFGLQLAVIIFLKAAVASNSPNKSPSLQKITMDTTILQQNDNVHQKTSKQKYYTISKNAYEIPDITLINEHGGKTRITELLNNEQPVLLQFIFTTCATICPVMSATFASAQDALEETNSGYRMVSISIDPDEDTPRVLEQYAKRFHAHKQWHFLTGSRDNIAKVQRAFDAYYPGNNKMYHQPYIFMRPQGIKNWIRFDGLMSSADLVREYRKLLALSEPSESKIDGH